MRTRRFSRRTRPTRRRRLNYRRKATIATNRFGTGFPDIFNTKLKYSVGLNLQSGTLTELSSFYNGNVPFDPDTRLGGKSAIEYQYLIPIYRWCRCFASKIKAVSVVSNNNPVMIAFCPVTSSQPVVFDLLVGDKRAKKSQWMTPTAQNRATLTNYCTTKAVFGLKSPINENDHFYDMNNVTRDRPTETWLWYILTRVPEGFSPPANVALQLEITYYCRFFEKIQPPFFDLEPEDDPDPIDWVGNPDPDNNIFNPEEP